MDEAKGIKTNLYFVSPAVDVCVIGGASVLAYLLLLKFRQEIAMESVYMASAMLVYVVNWPHFSATSWRLYHSRENIRQYPVTAIVIPFVILAGVLGCFASPQQIAPYFVKIYVIWSPYHFCAQTLGITLLYARRAGIRLEPWERFAFASFIFSTFIMPAVRFETGAMGSDYYGITYPSLGLPGWSLTVANLWLWATGLTVVLVFLRWTLRDRRLPPLIIFLPALAQLIWFVPGGRLPAFNEFVPFFHGLQYLLVAWALQLKERMDAESIQPSSRYVFWESVRWALLNIAGGLLLFETLPLLFSSLSLSASFVTGVVFSAVQIHHFFVDGVIWKLRSKTVSAPLMTSLPELSGSTLARSVL